MLTIVAHAQYDFNDLQPQWVAYELLEKCQKHDIELIIAPKDKGIERLKRSDKIDILIVDAHSWKTEGDIVALCRQLHPETKIVMYDELLFSQQGGKRYDAWVHMDYYHLNPAGVICSVLMKLKIWEEKDWYRWMGFQYPD